MTHLASRVSCWLSAVGSMHDVRLYFDCFILHTVYHILNVFRLFHIAHCSSYLECISIVSCCILFIITWMHFNCFILRTVYHIMNVTCMTLVLRHATTRLLHTALSNFIVFTAWLNMLLTCISFLIHCSQHAWRQDAFRFLLTVSIMHDVSMYFFSYTLLAVCISFVSYCNLFVIPCW